MANKAQYPLLAQGINLAGATATIAAAGVSRVNNNTQKGRGNVKMIDLISNQIAGAVSSTLYSLILGGQTVIQDSLFSEFLGDAFPGGYMPYMVDIGEGQTFQSILDNTNSVLVAGGALHFFYENKFDNPDHWGLFNDRDLTLKSRTFAFTAGAGLTTNTQIIVPSQYGDVIGAQLVGDSGTRAATLVSFSTVKANGVDIFKSVSNALADPPTGRPYQIFPVGIEEGSTIDFNLDNTFGATTVRIGLKLFFGKNNK